MAATALTPALTESPLQAEPLGCPEFLATRYDEFHLISRRLTAALFDSLLLWDDKRRSWQKPPAGHVVVRGRIVILHFWADYCAPCRAEFPWLKELVRELVIKYKGQVQPIFVSETNSAQAMSQFMEQNSAILPWGESPHYLDTDSHMLQLLGNGLPSGTLPLPTTLICDPFIVRQGIIGSLIQRRTDLRGAIERLLQALSLTP